MVYGELLQEVKLIKLRFINNPSYPHQLQYNMQIKIVIINTENTAM